MRLKGLWIHPRSGLPYYRTRRGGQTRLVALPPDLPFDHPDFIAAWSAAARQTDAPQAHRAGTIGSTWAALLASSTAAAWSPVYRATIERQARAICERGGDVVATAVQPRHVRADLRAASNPSARRKAWRLWARFCLEHEWITDDPTHGVAAPAQDHGLGFKAWSRDQITAFRRAHPIGSTPRAIMELTYWTGARISDVVLIGRQHVQHDGLLVFRQAKTGDLSYVPWTSALPDYAASMAGDRDMAHAAVAHLTGGLTFLHTARGQARSPKSAGHVVAKAAATAGFDRSAHGLRKARAAHLAEAGATANQIAAWTGHRSLSEVTHYTAEADRRRAVMGTKLETMPGQVETMGNKPLK